MHPTAIPVNGRNLTGQEAGGFHWRRFVED